jgi:hypothetical protein
MGRAYSTHVEKRMYIAFRWEGEKERDNYEDPDVGGMIIKWILEKKGYGGMEWIHLTQDWDQWRALVNMIKNLRAP